ncbi:enoyl-[acyl-carrier-protein] reductase [NADH] [Streptomyces spiroverticillatus]|uniref:Enoyl-[acyl-carrier-protein] reductase [NADH] n=1 Tax=Streptomyces finlayi TaxID=67296 RepID=A0A918X4Z3_9ACTN|nr:enoyl-ACP reductase FabI [Streptomyces finlayi]GHA36097.1 enoyl-[acyl-carrier-protein] reductase [NADH] [Streptomyces spiroverticillatus]GHD12446.1 enoyl-[acyl-carrier-protein] reductase [NADH] [Streptomyces finlayi]
MSGLLDGKQLIVTGVISEKSIAYSVARLAQEQGARVVLTAYGRRSLVERIARRLPSEAPVVDLDVTDEEQLASLAERVGAHVDGVDGVLHSIAHAPESCLDGRFLTAPWQDVASALHTSAYSLKALAVAAAPLLRPKASLVAVDFDAARTWPGYDWMGVAKAGLEACGRYLARDLGPSGVRVNLVAAGPLRTLAARGIGGDGEAFEKQWAADAPLGWDAHDAGPVAHTCLALLSDWLPATTGEIIHADGGRHIVG